MKFTTRYLSLMVLAALIYSCAGTKTKGTFSRLDEKQFEKSIKKYLGTPYVWGGTSKKGVDCSGFTSLVYKDQGVLLPRTSREQFRVGKTIPLSEVQKGDLLFFNTYGRGVTHVGIHVDDHRMVHASSSGGVKFAKYDTKYWQDRFIAAKRVVGSRFVQGELASERVLVSNEFPMRVRDLINLPTTTTMAKRHYYLDFRTNVTGDLTVSSAIGFWNRLEIGGGITIKHMLSDSSVGLEEPQLFAKFRFWDEGGWYPSAAIGISTVRNKLFKPDSAGIAQPDWGERRGLYAVFGKTVFQGGKWYLGDGKVFLGTGTTFLEKNLKINQLYLFAAYEQQLLTNLLYILEIDDIFRDGTYNMAIRYAFNAVSSVEFSLSNLFEKDINVGRALRFTYYLSY